jgi:hypothetical protein
MVDSSVSSGPGPGKASWLLLLHHLPPRPAYLRVKVRRRLQRIGALPLKNSVYVLPQSAEAREDLEWLRAEIVAAGGEAIVTTATFIAGVREDQLAARFRKLRKEAPMKATPRPKRGVPRKPAGPPPPRIRGAVWVTRRGVFVDRIASAWLVARFIDPRARFKFVAPRGYRPARGEYRFDMFEGEFTHQGDHCTFETLLDRFRLDDPALHRLAEIVHDIDCKDEKFGREETATIRTVLEGVALAHPKDEARLAAGRVVFDGLYQRFRRPS